MAVKRTLRRIINALIDIGSTTTRIDGYRYAVKIEEDDVILTPFGKSGDVVSSAIKRDTYAYTHGGPIFREALDLAKEISEELRRKRGGEDKTPAFIESLKWNGQIVRFFDVDALEYDLAPANAQVAQGQIIFQVSWTSAQGYEITHIFNQ